MAAAVEESLLVLAQAIKVLVFRGREGCADFIERVVCGAAIYEDAGVAVLVIRDRHLPAPHLDKRRAVRVLDRNIDAGRRAAEELGDVGLRSGGRVFRALRGNGNRHTRGPHHISASA